MSPDRQAEAAVRRIYESTAKLLNSGVDPDQAALALTNEGLDRASAHSVVKRLVEARRAALNGDLGYRTWLKHVIANPFRSGFLVALLTVLTVPFTLLAAVVGLLFIPPGTYPRIALAAPGIIAGLLFFLVLSSVLFVLRRLFA